MNGEESGIGPSVAAAGLELRFVLRTAIETGMECLLQTFLIVTLGTVALQMVGGICGKMIPSAPPVFHRPTLAEEPVPTESKLVLSRWFREHRYAIVFGLVFIPSLCARLASRQGSRAATYIENLRTKVLNDWFSLLVMNALVASVSAVVLSMVSRQDWAGRFLGFVTASGWESVRPLLDLLFGRGISATAEEWAAWYSNNVLKFSFWLLYLSAICDDLGIPNLKTLTRRIWLRALSTSGL